MVKLFVIDDFKMTNKTLVGENNFLRRRNRNLELEYKRLLKRKTSNIKVSIYNNLINEARKNRYSNNLDKFVRIYLIEEMKKEAKYESN